MTTDAESDNSTSPGADDVGELDESLVTDEVEATEQRRRSGRLAMALVVVLAIVAAAAVGWGLGQRREAADARAVADRQREAVIVATGFVEALMSYDHRDLDAQVAAVERFSTSGFRDEYDDAFTADVRDQIEAEQANSEVTVEQVFITLGDGDEVDALVVARSRVSSDRGATAELESFLRVRLVHLDGRWQVEDLTSLGSRDRSEPLPSNAPASDGVPIDEAEATTPDVSDDDG